MARSTCCDARPSCSTCAARCRSSPTQRPSCDRPDRRSGSTRRGQCHECVACVHHIVCHTLHHAAPHAAHHPDRRGSWQRCRGCSGPLTTRASEATPRSTPRPTTSPTCARRWHVRLQPLAGRAAASDTARAAASSRRDRACRLPYTRTTRLPTRTPRPMWLASCSAARSSGTT
eukprot:scaffold85992_cov63-Phaeocystis_antarctica.AAC.5